jgi:uncharacterized membrane protein YfcA
MGPTALALAAGIGFTLGLLGAGGSILVVPALTFLMGFDAKQAVVTSLAAVGLAAAAGAIASYFRGTLPVKPAIIIGLTTMVGAFGGARIGAVLPDRTQLMILATVMVGAAAGMLYRAVPAGDRPVSVTSKRPFVLGALGVAIGIVTGMVGVGGGFLIVPALVLAGRLPMREASSASLLAIALASAAGLAGYAGRVHPAWSFVAPFAMVASAGTIAGGIVAHRLPQQRVQQIFAVALVAIAAFMFTRG